MRLTEWEIDLIVEALTKSASRHESEARFRPGTKSASDHEITAKVMRELLGKFLMYDEPKSA